MAPRHAPPTSCLAGLLALAILVGQVDTAGADPVCTGSVSTNRSKYFTGDQFTATGHIQCSAPTTGDLYTGFAFAHRSCPRPGDFLVVFIGESDTLTICFLDLPGSVTQFPRMRGVSIQGSADLPLSSFRVPGGAGLSVANLELAAAMFMLLAQPGVFTTSDFLVVALILLLFSLNPNF